MSKPSVKPQNTFFSSGPCAKRPGWSADQLPSRTVGRSHRAKVSKAVIEEVIAKSKQILGVPDDYRLGIVPGSDTGAIEMALWNFFGHPSVESRGIDMLAWENFGYEWVYDVEKQLKIANVRPMVVPYGQIPDLTQVDFHHDVVFTWNGTTSGVCVPDATWIPDDREGLTICDATSAVFAMPIDWKKIDVLTYSWQKSMGGEGAHGVLILSPRAIQRLESFPPIIAMPKVFTILKKGKLNEEIFTGATINTPSMLCIEDALDSLNWMIREGGLTAMIARSQQSLSEIKTWIASSPRYAFLAENPKTISNTSVCLKLKSDMYLSLSPDAQVKFAKDVAALLEKEGAAYDIGSYRDAPPGLRIWCGATINPADVKLLLPWLDWAHDEIARTLKF